MGRVGDDCQIGAHDRFSVGKGTGDAKRSGVSAAAKIELPKFGKMRYNFPERGR